MIQDLCWDFDGDYLYSACVDETARSWMPHLNDDEVRVFEGAQGNVIAILCKGNIRECARVIHTEPENEDNDDDAHSEHDTKQHAPRSPYTMKKASLSP